MLPIVSGSDGCKFYGEPDEQYPEINARAVPAINDREVANEEQDLEHDTERKEDPRQRAARDIIRRRDIGEAWSQFRVVSQAYSRQRRRKKYGTHVTQARMV